MIASEAAEVWSITEPFAVKVFRPFLEDNVFNELRREFPSPELLALSTNVGYKRSASDAKRGSAFFELAETRPAWRRFRSAMLDGEFLRFLWPHFEALRKQAVVNQRIEMSLLPACGGCVFPHADAGKKIVTMVVYLADDDWHEKWGGGFAVLVPSGRFDRGRIGFQDVSVFAEVPFRPNTAVVMEKSDRSFHAVYPVNAPPKRDRRTATINFIGEERAA